MIIVLYIPSISVFEIWFCHMYVYTLQLLHNAILWDGIPNPNRSGKISKPCCMGVNCRLYTEIKSLIASWGLTLTVIY